MLNWKRNSHKRLYNQKEIFGIYSAGQAQSEKEKASPYGRSADGTWKVGFLLHAEEDLILLPFPPDHVEIFKKLKNL